MQSDFREALSENGDDDSDVLPEELSLSLFTRFFIDDMDSTDSNGVVRASELRLGYIFDKQDQRLMEYYQLGGLDINDDLNRIPPVTHGYAFKNMFNRSREISMYNQVISAYHFSQDGDFAGLTLRDIKSGTENRYLTEHLNNLVTYG